MIFFYHKNQILTNFFDLNNIFDLNNFFDLNNIFDLNIFFDLKLSAQPYGRPNAKYAHFFTSTRYLMCM